MTRRGLSPVLGTVVLLAITVALASVVGMAVGAYGTDAPTPRVDLTASADATADSITITHRQGESLDIEALDLQIRIDGQPLDHQPPVPFFAAEGFHSGPTGPFNSASTDPWSAGESATLRLASTNAPLLSEGSTVTIELTHDRAVLATLTVTAT